jgi:hypothetical protein
VIFGGSVTLMLGLGQRIGTTFLPKSKIDLIGGRGIGLGII